MVRLGSFAVAVECREGPGARRMCARRHLRESPEQWEAFRDEPRRGQL